MTQISIITLVQDALWLFMKVAMPILAVAVVVGLLVSILQAATSIQEQTLTFVPKMIAMVLVIFFFGGWMFAMFRDYSIRLFSSLAGLAY